MDYEKLYAVIEILKEQNKDDEELSQRLDELKQEMQAQELQEQERERIESKISSKGSGSSGDYSYMSNPLMGKLGGTLKGLLSGGSTTSSLAGSSGTGEGIWSVNPASSIQGGSEGMGGAFGLGAAIGAGIVLQHGLAEHTNRYTEGVKSGDAFSGQFGSEPWLNFAYQELGIDRPSAGEKFDAAIKNRDWGSALKRSLSMSSYWGNPAERVLYEIGTDKLGSKAGFLLSPLNWLFDKIGG